jgi:type II secretory pathway component PulJ
MGMVNILARLSKWFLRSPFLRGGSRASQGCLAADGQGFGLLEVLVATALMGAVLVALLRILTGAMRAQEIILENNQALQVAEDVLQETCNAMKLEAAASQGQDGSYNYKVLVTPQYEVREQRFSRVVRCSLIQVTVFWRKQGRNRSLSLETIRTSSQRTF